MCIGSSLENEKRVYSFFKDSNKRGNKIGGQGMGFGFKSLPLSIL